MPSPVISRAQKAERSQLNKLAHTLAEYAPRQVKQEWVAKFHDQASDAFGKLLTGSAHACPECGCNRPNVQAVRLYCELAGAVGAQNQFFLSLGFPSEADLMQRLESGARFEELRAEASPQALLEASLEVVQMVLGKHPDVTGLMRVVGVVVGLLGEHPEWREMVLARLTSFAEEANGHT